MPPRRRNRLDRQVLGVVKIAPKPDCECGELWRQHQPRGSGDERGYCLNPDCRCTAYRPMQVRR